ncbi:uncharacterized protein BKA55DRAFT_499718 [Fusarium redolens]|uniref:Ankyrin repeat protein n=1 Tax=Fusarium redolens TaxID=48865 RepID=A0A9P9R6G3_FUSRE|nr:uncharacterized protein BKA55DRAFT_499718 [Fusarium redolens]KAH7267100.1 hypothetical protein BKA55DRAFT_499718 [Fusarium redolens]
MSALVVGRPNPSRGLPNTPAVKTFRIGELLLLIVEELGERTEQKPLYQNLGSLANLILANKSLFSSLQAYLYTQDLKDDCHKGLQHAVFNCSDQVGYHIISKYPVQLLKRRINKIYKRSTAKAKATFTLLHIAAAQQQHRVIRKLGRLGAKYLDAKNLHLVLSQEFRDRLEQESELVNHLPRLRWKPALAPLVLHQVATFDLLDEYWEAVYVGTFNFHALAVNGVVPPKPPFWPMTVHQLAAILGDRNYSVQLMRKAVETHPSENEFPGGLERYSVLHFAIKAYNFRALKYVLESGVGFGRYMVDALGNNPLHCVFRLALESANNSASRSACRKMVDELMDNHGFHHRMIRTCYPHESPILIVAESVRVDWSGRLHMIKYLLGKCLQSETDMRLRRGYDPASHRNMMNVPDACGNTVLGFVSQAIIAHEGNDALEGLFRRLVRHGADINLDINPRYRPRRYAHSIKFIAQDAPGCAKFKKTVDSLGGRLHQAEIEGTAIGFDGIIYRDHEPHVHSLPPEHLFAQEHP